MDNHQFAGGLSLICAIVNCGSGSKVMHAGKQYGLTGGTVMIAKGTAHRHILEFLGLADTKKEVVLMLGTGEIVRPAALGITEELKMKKPNHGILFTIPVCDVTGTHSIACGGEAQATEGVRKAMYRMITVIVPRGDAEEVIDAAAQGGAKGGTIINARGSGTHETERLFMMEIEPEKEIVIVISKTEDAAPIADSIRDNLDLESPGKGIMFIQDIGEVYGMVE
ncbi:MAG: P-II family nitrogen regulator [Acutalibacteraceae bacterium]|jgi:nitrogen regulatory protein PII